MSVPNLILLRKIIYLTFLVIKEGLIISDGDDFLTIFRGILVQGPIM